MRVIWYSASGIALLLMLSMPVLPQKTDQVIQELYVQAKAEEQAHHLDIAVGKYQAILKRDPKLAAAYNNLGRLYFQQSRFDEAIKELKRACDLAPDSAPPHALLGLSLFQKGDFQSAKRELTVTLRLNPQDSNVKLFLARSFVGTGDYRSAVELLEQLRQYDPHNPEALYTLGSVYSTLAASTFSDIQSVAPDSYIVELLLGKAAEAKQILPDAVEHYKRAIARAPDNAELYYLYAHSQQEMGDLVDALSAYRKSLALSSYNASANWEAARIVLGDDPAEALRLADRALQLDPEVSDAHMIRGQALMSLDRPKEAAEAFRKASSLNPEDGAVHFQLGRAYRQLGMSNEASNEETLFRNLQRESHALKEDELAK